MKRMLLVVVSLLAAAAPASRPALTAAARHQIEDMFLLRDLRFDCSDFSYRDRIITAKQISLTPDDGPDRVAARNGNPPSPKLTIASAIVTLERDIHPDGYPSFVSIHLDHPTVPLSREQIAATQPAWDLGLFLWAKCINAAGAPEWTELFRNSDNSGDPLDGYPNLREVTIDDFTYKTPSKIAGKPAAILFSLHVVRDAPNHWKGEIKSAVRTPEDPRAPLEGPTRFELKSEGGKLLIRCTDSQPTTTPVQTRP